MSNKNSEAKQKCTVKKSNWIIKKISLVVSISSSTGSGGEGLKGYNKLWCVDVTVHCV